MTGDGADSLTAHYARAQQAADAVRALLLADDDAVTFEIRRCAWALVLQCQRGKITDRDQRASIGRLADALGIAETQNDVIQA